MSDDELRSAFLELRATGDRQVRNRIVEDHRWIAVTSAARFRDRGEPMDDLVQVAMLGLVKATERFDPDNGTPFAGFALPTVLGELRRHFRDATWAVHVPRRMKELSALVGPANERLRERLGRYPTMVEVAEELRVDVEQVIAALEAVSAYRPASMDAPRTADGEQGLDLGSDDPAFDRADASLAVRRLLATLPDRERRILELRFFDELSQSEIAARVGTSQVHVSRLIRASLTALRDELEPALADGSRGDEP